jgi:site-specific recombinase XerD
MHKTNNHNPQKKERKMSAKAKRTKVKGYAGIYKIEWTDKNAVAKVKFGFQVMVNGNRVSQNDFDTVEQALSGKLTRMAKLAKTNGNESTLSLESVIDKKVEYSIDIMKRRDSHRDVYESLKNGMSKELLDTPFAKIKEQQMFDFIYGIKGNGTGRRTTKRLLTSVFKFARSKMQPRIKNDAMRDIDTPVVDSTRKHCPTFAELEILFADMPQDTRDIYEGCFILGARSGYADESGFSSITWSDIDFEKSMVSVAHHKNKRSERTVYQVPMGEKLKEILMRRKAQKDNRTDLVFFKLNGNNGTEPRKISNNDDSVLKRHCRNVGIKEFSMGALRNARAGHLLDTMKADLYHIQSWLGHKNLDTTIRYLESMGLNVKAQDLTHLAI